jgi:hypothetical protein
MPLTTRLNKPGLAPRSQAVFGSTSSRNEVAVWVLWSRASGVYESPS